MNFGRFFFKTRTKTSDKSMGERKEGKAEGTALTWSMSFFFFFVTLKEP
jgi:hypothetical protein